MRKIILSQHASLDGFVAGPNGEMDWIKVDESMFDFVGTFTNEADTALYGRVTYEMMDGYWPSAGAEPNASKHDVEHSTWYNKVDKIVISRSMRGTNKPQTKFIGENVADEIKKIKEQKGANILIFGSPSASHLLMENNLIDEYWIFVNPILLGKGIPLFAKIKDRTTLEFVTSKTFDNGVIGLNYLLKK